MINKRALTLLEIIISTIILAIVVTGLVNVFVASKNFIRHSRNRMAGGEIGKQFLDPLQAYVRQDTWAETTGTNCFNTDDPSNPANMTTKCPAIPASYTAGNTIYTPQYYISNIRSAEGVDLGLKKVKTVITWNEPAS